MMRFRRAIRLFFRFFRRLARPRRLTPGAIARMRLEDLRREQSHRWEIRPPSSECELPFGSGLASFENDNAGRATTEPARRIKISVNRLRCPRPRAGA
jgi:hypothetical protein